MNSFEVGVCLVLLTYDQTCYIAEDDGGWFDFIIRHSDKFCTIYFVKNLQQDL
jgi:hypothetical protein